MGLVRGGDLRGHQNDQHTQRTPEDAWHAVKVVHLSIQCGVKQQFKRNPHPAGVVDLQTGKELPADCLVADGGEHSSCTS